MGDKSPKSKTKGEKQKIAHGQKDAAKARDKKDKQGQQSPGKK